MALGYSLDSRDRADPPSTKASIAYFKKVVHRVKNVSKSMEKSAGEIELTKDQLLALLKAVYLGNWMANAHRDGSQEYPHREDYEAIEDYIFSYAKQFGFDKYVDDEDAAEGRFYPTRDFEERTDVAELHDEYDEESFWDELIDRLGERDFHRHYSQDEIKKMNRDERFARLNEFIDKWTDEINENGIERMEIKKDDYTN